MKRCHLSSTLKFGLNINWEAETSISKERGKEHHNIDSGNSGFPPFNPKMGDVRENAGKVKIKSSVETVR